MDLSGTEAHAALREEVHRFLAAHRSAAPTSRSLPRKAAPVLAWQRLLLDHGFAGREVPRAYGGFGAERDLLAGHVIAETFAAAGVPLGLGGQGVEMVVPTLLAIGTEAQRRAWIAPTLAGEMVWCQGFSEPEAGSDLASLRTCARDDGDHLVVTGQKIWTSSAHEADTMHALVRTGSGARKQEGITYIAIDMRSPGIEVRPIKNMTGKAFFDDRPSFNEVFLTEVRVPKAHVIGEIGQGWRAATTTLGNERGMLGDAQKLSARMAAILRLLCRERLDAGAALEDPSLTDRAMELQARVLAMRCHSWRLLSEAQSGKGGGLAPLVVKLQGCELNYDIATLACDILGVTSLVYGDDPRQAEEGLWAFREMYDLALIIGGGSAQIQKTIIAERGLGMPREPRATPSRARAG